MSKLSPVQADVIKKMQAGWELIFQGYLPWGTGAPVYVLQAGGYGSGGAMKHPTAATINALSRKGLIERPSKYEPKMTLTEEGRRTNIGLSKIARLRRAGVRIKFS